MMINPLLYYHKIQEYGISTYIYHKDYLNVGKSTSPCDPQYDINGGLSGL